MNVSIVVTIWIYVVIYDEEDDYVIALEFYNNDTPKVVEVMSEPTITTKEGSSARQQ